MEQGLIWEIEDIKALGGFWSYLKYQMIEMLKDDGMEEDEYWL